MNLRNRLITILFTFLALGTLAANDRALFEEAERRFTGGDFVIALDRYRALMERFPTSEFFATAELRSGQALYYLGRYTDALSRLQRAAARSQRGREQVVFWLGLTHFQLRDFGRAERTFDEYLGAGGGERARAHLYRGLSRRELGRIAEATSDIEITVDLGGLAEQGYATAILFDLYNRENRFVDAVALWDRLGESLGFDDEFAELRVRGAADAALATDRPALAGQLYQRLTAYSIAGAQWAYLRLFDLAGGDAAATAAIYREANARLAPEPQRLAEFWFHLGLDALNRGRFEVAELYLSQLWDVRAQRELSGAVPLYLARAIEQQDRLQEALSVLESSFDGPFDALAERQLLAARLAVALARFDRAVELLSETPAGAELESVGGDWFYTKAYALYADGRSAQALEVLDGSQARAYTATMTTALRLRARLALEGPDPVRAVRAYREFMATGEPTAAVRVELLRALLAASQDRAVLQENAVINAAELSPRLAAERAFLVGVAALRLNEFERAHRELASAVAMPDGAALQPLLDYHFAWAAYRIGRLDEARVALARLNGSPLPAEFTFSARYLQGYIAYQLGDGATAIRYLLELLGSGLTPPQTVQVRTLLASAYLLRNELDPALEQYRRIMALAVSEADTTAAWSRYATVLDTAGRSNEAIEEFLALHARYPESDAGRNALLEAAQLAFTGGDYRRARELFRNYLGRYRGSPEYDRALYWAGAASLELGEGGAALLWWEPLMEEYPRSTFTPRALLQTAQLYRNRGQSARALELYDRLSVVYRGTTFAQEAERARTQLRLELDGLSDREAQLWVRLDGPNALRAGSPEWFAVVLELGRIAVREQVTLSVQRTVIVDRLIVAGNEFSGPNATEALILLAEYYQRRGEIRAAIDNYINAARKAGAGEDQRAQSLYQVAVLSRDSGDRAAFTSTVEELRRLFPQSVWTIRAVELLGGQQ